MKATITKALVADYHKKAKAGQITKPVEVNDTDLKGFILRAQPSGRLAYIVQLGRGKRITIGDAAVLTPAQGRAKAKAALGAQAEGRNPKDVLRRDPEGVKTAPTLRAYIEGPYADWSKVNRKTGAETVSRIAACFFAEFGETPIDQITAWNVEKWRRARLQQGRAVGTVNRDLMALKASLSRAVDWEIIDRHPLTKIKPHREDHNAVVRYLTEDEEKRLRAALVARDDESRAARERGNAWREVRHLDTRPAIATYADHLTPMVLLSLNTGLRQGEVFNLTWSDIDMPRAMLTVRGEGAKSGKTRHVPLNAEALSALKTWQEQTAPEAAALVFPGKRGGRFDNVSKSWAAVLAAAGITGFRWHDMRHHFASRLVMVGVDLNTVRELLGHADLKMTLRYAHLAPEHKAAAVARLVAP